MTPRPIQTTLDDFGAEALRLAPDRWRLIDENQGSDQLGSRGRIHDSHSEPVLRVGSVLVAIHPEPPPQAPARTTLILDLIYPRDYATQRALFDEFDFGWDDFASVVTGRHYVENPSTPELIAQRKAAVLDIFDRMNVKSPIALMTVTASTAIVRFAEPPTRAEADYWADAAWQLYIENYGHEGGGQFDPTGLFTRREFFRMTRKRGIFIAGQCHGIDEPPTKDPVRRKQIGGKGQE